MGFVKIRFRYGIAAINSRLCYYPAPSVINSGCTQDSRRAAAFDSASMNDERPTTNDIADGDEFRPAVCELRPALLSSLLVYDIINVIIELY